jgi:hypothetical protein
VYVNRNTRVNNITYVNQRVNNGVTVVSHDTFVNARPVAGNIMRVEPREIASAPVSHMVRAEPIRASVVGSGRPALVKPPVSTISRPVVAVRTPEAPPRPIEQRQQQAGGRLNEQILVRPVGPSQPAQVEHGGRPQQPTQEGFKPFGPPSGGNPPVRTMQQPQPRVYEQQGTPQVDNRNGQQPDNRNMQQQPVNRNGQQPESHMQQPVNREPYRAPQREEVRPPIQETHPLVRQAPPVQERNQQQEQQQAEKFHQWQQQRPASPPPAAAPRSAPAPRAPDSKPAPPSKKGR